MPQDRPERHVRRGECPREALSRDANENVSSILTHGFRDGGPIPTACGEIFGVFAADQPPMFGRGWALLVIETDLEEADLCALRLQHARLATAPQSLPRMAPPCGQVAAAGKRHRINRGEDRRWCVELPEADLRLLIATDSVATTVEPPLTRCSMRLDRQSCALRSRSEGPQG